MTNVPATIQERIALPSAARGKPADGNQLTPADILAMLRRRTVLVTVLFFLFSALAVGGFIVWWMYFPLYTSSALIECVSNLPQSELAVQQERPRKDEHDRFIMTQATLIRSQNILQTALQRPAVRATQWFTEIPEDEKILTLKEDLSASRVVGTNFLNVAMSCKNPNDPHVVINAVVQVWHNRVKDQYADAFAGQLSSTREEKNRVEGQIASNRELLRRIAEQLPPGAAHQEVNIVAQQVMQYGEQVALLELERSQLEQFRNIYNSSDSTAVTAEDRQMVEADPQISMLAQNAFAIEQRMAADRETFGPEHLETKRLEAQLDAALQELDRLRSQKLSEIRADLREAANTAYYNTQHALFVAKENLEKAQASLQDQDQLLFDYQNLQEEIDQDEIYLTRLTDYVSSLERVVLQRTALRVNITQEAVPPDRRSSPNIFMLPVGIFLALAMALAVGLGLELINTSIRTPQDIVRHLDVAMLGVVPDVDDEEITIEHIETASRDAPRSMVAEAFRRIRTNMQFSAPAARQRTVLVTSPRPEDGRTSVAANLAITVAQGGKRVLLVDANFRRPGLKRVFPQINGKGLSNILVSDGDLTSHVVPSGIPMLDVLGSGPIPPNPAELLGGEMFGSFLEDAISRYDQIIFDSPPVLVASDAIVLASAMDGVILVVRANENSRGIGRRTYALLTDVNAHVFGAILNAARVTRGGYFREQLRSYYDYQADQTDEQILPPGSPSGQPKSANGNGNGLSKHVEGNGGNKGDEDPDD